MTPSVKRGTLTHQPSFTLNCRHSTASLINMEHNDSTEYEGPWGTLFRIPSHTHNWKALTHTHTHGGRSYEQILRGLEEQFHRFFHSCLVTPRWPFWALRGDGVFYVCWGGSTLLMFQNLSGTFTSYYFILIILYFFEFEEDSTQALRVSAEEIQIFFSPFFWSLNKKQRWPRL